MFGIGLAELVVVAGITLLVGTVFTLLVAAAIKILRSKRLG